MLEEEIHSVSIVEAVKEGYLSPFSVYLAQTDVDISAVPLVGGEYNQQELAKAIDIQTRNQAVVDLYINLFNGQQAVAYCLSVQHATNLAAGFRERGFLLP